jgi:hypothetical protein
MALAEPLDGRTWKVRRDVMAVLRSMKKATDRQKMLAAHAALVSDPRLPLQYTPARSIQHLEGRVIAHTLDESSGITHMILEGTDAKVHLIPHDEVIESARQRGRLQPNSFIRLRKRKIDDRLHADDLGDADQYLQSHHFREDMRRLGPDYLEGGWAGWLGRYQKAAQAVFSQRGRRSFRAAGRDR